MKKKFTSIACGLSTVSLLAFALVACDSDSPSAPAESTTCNCNTASSSSCDGVPESSGGDERPVSSSSSSSEKTICVDIEKMCRPCKGDDCPTTATPCSSCDDWPIGHEAPQCNTGEIYICNQFHAWSATGLYEGYLEEMATDVKVESRTGAALTPRVLKVVNADSSVTFRDDGANIYNIFAVDGVKGILSGDTLNVKILYPDSAYNGSSKQGVITFTLSKAFANVTKFKYLEATAKPIFEEVSSSSSVIASSSSWKVECITMSKLCPPCDDDDCPIPFMPCNQCYGMYGAETYDCETNERYVCSRFDTWDQTCMNITDSTGSSAEDSCEYNFAAWLDCKTNKPFVCKEGHWERLPDEYSWLHQKCDSGENNRSVYVEYETEKGSIAKVRLGFYCNGISWQRSSTSQPERSRCEIELDKVTVDGKTYQCIGGEWEVYQKCDELKVECGYTAEELCNDYGIERYCSKS